MEGKKCIVLGIVVVICSLALFAVGYYLGWKGSSTYVPPPVTKDGIAQEFSEPMDCVNYYYDAVMKCNHEQYQFCVLDPLSPEEFRKKVNKRLEEMRKHGIKQIERPVKGRSAKFKESKGSKSAQVKAMSPWTHKEETYIVIEQGQSWRMVKEK